MMACLFLFLLSQPQESLIRHIHRIFKGASTLIDKHKDRINEPVEGSTILTLGLDIVLHLSKTNILYQFRSHRSKIYHAAKIGTIKMSVKKK